MEARDGVQNGFESQVKVSSRCINAPSIAYNAKTATEESKHVETRV